MRKEETGRAESGDLVTGKAGEGAPRPEYLCTACPPRGRPSYSRCPPSRWRKPHFLCSPGRRPPRFPGFCQK